MESGGRRISTAYRRIREILPLRYAQGQNDKGARRGIPTGKGASLLEAVIALAVAGLTVPAVFGMISFGADYSARARDHTTIMRLATAQMESIKQQPYQAMPASYLPVSAPEGYAIQVTVTNPTAPAYSYPDATAVGNAVQKVEVKVTGRYTDRTLISYKVKLD